MAGPAARPPAVVGRRLCHRAEQSGMAEPLAVEAAGEARHQVARPVAAARRTKPERAVAADRPLAAATVAPRSAEAARPLEARAAAVVRPGRGVRPTQPAGRRAPGEPLRRSGHALPTVNAPTATVSVRAAFAGTPIKRCVAVLALTSNTTTTLAAIATIAAQQQHHVVTTAFVNVTARPAMGHRLAADRAAADLPAVAACPPVAAKLAAA